MLSTKEIRIGRYAIYYVKKHKNKVAAIRDYPINIKHLQSCKQPVYNANDDAISANSSGVNFNFSR